MTREQLIQQIFLKRSYLCIGLDTDMAKLPGHMPSHPEAVLAFNRKIIDATKDLCVAYKLNTAFYEALGAPGWEVMKKTAEYIPPSHLKIADAKRGDIGNTSSQYARAFFETLNFDAITVAPYMGEDSIRPFLDYKNKWTIVLGLTSNKGSADFQQLRTGDQFLYESVLKKVSAWGHPDNLMFVIGATKAGDVSTVRQLIPENFLLVPGIGAQGGDLQEVSKAGITTGCGLLVNVSRAVIYAGGDHDFAVQAGIAAKQYQAEMERFLKPGS